MEVSGRAKPEPEPRESNSHFQRNRILNLTLLITTNYAYFIFVKGRLRHRLTTPRTPRAPEMDLRRIVGIFYSAWNLEKPYKIKEIQSFCVIFTILTRKFVEIYYIMYEALNSRRANFFCLNNHLH